MKSTDRDTTLMGAKSCGQLSQRHFDLLMPHLQPFITEFDKETPKHREGVLLALINVVGSGHQTKLTTIYKDLLNIAHRSFLASEQMIRAAGFPTILPSQP